MKHSSDHSLWALRIPLLFLAIIFLFLRASTASRLLPPTQTGRDSDEVAGFLQASRVVDEEREDNTWDLMGMEECEDGNEECLKRRVISEAHLDYIYTQRHHKP